MAIAPTRLLSVALTVLVLAGCVQLRSPFGSAHSIGPSTAVAPGRGTVIFSDDFKDAGSGWTTSQQASGTTYSYDTVGYVIKAVGGDLVHLVPSPYAHRLQQLGISVTARISADSAPGSGFGLACRRGSGSGEISYEMYVRNDGSWLVALRTGRPDPNKPSDALRRGSVSVGVGPFTQTVEGVCATLQGGRSTRLLLFLGSSKLADFIDTVSSSLPDSGWIAMLVTRSVEQGPATITVSEFVERDAAA